MGTKNLQMILPLPCNDGQKPAKDSTLPACASLQGDVLRAKGVVYLIHFDVPLGDLANVHGKAQHYGYTDNLDARLDAHRGGNGSAIMAAVGQAGITWRVVRTWAGDRSLERKLKQRKNAPRLCPICCLGRQAALPLVIESDDDRR